MNATQQRITDLRLKKTVYSTAELDRLGWSRYAELRDQLEPAHRGEFVMIEVDSGDYFLGDTPQMALARARAAYPERVFCLIRIGYPAAHKLKRG